MSERWREACAYLPARHRHCKHGHLSDCPTPWQCPLLHPAEEPRCTYAVQAGPTLWLFSNATLADLHVQVLLHGGAKVRVTQHDSERAVQEMIRRLDPRFRQTIEDTR